MSRGHPAIPPDREVEFARDWNADMLGRDMAQKYGCTCSVVSRTAMRLGLNKRYGEDFELRGGSWQSNGRVMVWCPDVAASARPPHSSSASASGCSPRR